MATSPLVNDSSLVTYNILLDGKAISSKYALLELNVNRSVNEIGSALFQVFSVSENPFEGLIEASESNEFSIGRKVTIQLGYDNKNKEVFQGILVSQNMVINEPNTSYLQIECKEETFKLTTNKKTAAFTDATDSEIISKVLSTAGLAVEVDTTTQKTPQLIQNQQTDWDFILSLANANGFLVYSNGDKVYVKKPATSTAAILMLTLGQDVLDFAGTLEADKSTFSTGTISPSTVATLSNSLSASINTLSSNSKKPLKSGRVSFPGSALANLNEVIELNGFGKRFNGDTIISDLTHRLAEGEWRTEVNFGLPVELTQTNERGQMQLLSSSNGLLKGVVKSIAGDPNEAYRIKVTVPNLEASVWARLSTFYANEKQGAFFVPEIGDEVVLGFFNDDTRFPVILGSMFNKENEPPYSFDDANHIKAFSSRTGLSIKMDDNERTVTITTPAANEMILDDNRSSITMQDQNGNSIVMDNDGITIKSSKDVKIEAGDELNLKATRTMKGESSGGDIVLKGQNFLGEGTIDATLKGGATSELSAGGQTRIQGAMVMIN